MIPERISEHLENEIGITVINSQPVSGGSINRAAKINTSDETFFVKWNDSAPDNFFEAEADGLMRLRQAESPLRIPKVIAHEPPADNRDGFLVLEYIHSGSSGDSKAFGAGLAQLHQKKGDRFGLKKDNYIGSLPQSNTRHDGWTAFFAEERIKPQLKMAVDSGRMDSGIMKNWDRLASRLDEIMPPAKPSLLHGDLWSGNYLFDESGSAVLIDPAVYYGHPEVDLAFSKMFGGFRTSFYDGYESVTPLEQGFEKRVPVYNLYPLLVHVNLFGGHYITQCRSVLNQF